MSQEKIKEVERIIDKFFFPHWEEPNDLLQDEMFREYDYQKKRCVQAIVNYFEKQQKKDLKPILDVWERMTTADEPWVDRIDPEEIEQAIKQLAESYQPT